MHSIFPIFHCIATSTRHEICVLQCYTISFYESKCTSYIHLQKNVHIICCTQLIYWISYTLTTPFTQHIKPTLMYRTHLEGRSGLLPQSHWYGWSHLHTCFCCCVALLLLSPPFLLLFDDLFFTIFYARRASWYVVEAIDYTLTIYLYDRPLLVWDRLWWLTPTNYIWR